MTPILPIRKTPGSAIAAIRMATVSAARSAAFCGGFNCTGYYNQLGNLGMQFGISGFGGVPYGSFGFRGYGIGGFGGGGFGGGLNISGGFGGNQGFQGGGLQIGGGNLGFVGGQGQFSHGGQMGMSFGFNRDFGPLSPAARCRSPAWGSAMRWSAASFADSAFWTAKLRTNATGKASTTFKLPDSLTTWRVQVTAVSPKMHVGSGVAKFKSTRSIMIWPMLPRTFTEGNTVRVFGTVHNLTNKERGEESTSRPRTVRCSPMPNNR